MSLKEHYDGKQSRSKWFYPYWSEVIAFETERLKFCAVTPNDINIIMGMETHVDNGY